MNVPVRRRLERRHRRTLLDFTIGQLLDFQVGVRPGETGWPGGIRGYFEDYVDVRDEYLSRAHVRAIPGRETPFAEQLYQAVGKGPRNEELEAVAARLFAERYPSYEAASAGDRNDSTIH